MNTSTCDPRTGQAGTFEAETAEDAPERGIWVLMRPVRPRIHLAMGLAALGRPSIFECCPAARTLGPRIPKRRAVTHENRRSHRQRPQ